MPLDKLLVSTYNKGKFVELCDLLSPLGIPIVDLDTLGISESVEETGKSLYENALIKARYYYKKTGICTLADDSGLEVEALGGLPGVYSSRFAGKHATDKKRIDKLLRALEGKPKPWICLYRCVVAVCVGNGIELTFEGTVGGEITDSPRGENGFGYDPVFYLRGLKRTMAEMPMSIKNQISHRAQAVRAFVNSGVIAYL